MTAKEPPGPRRRPDRDRASAAASTTPRSCTRTDPLGARRSGSSRSPTAPTSARRCWSAPAAARSRCTSTTPPGINRVSRGSATTPTSTADQQPRPGADLPRARAHRGRRPPRSSADVNAGLRQPRRDLRRLRRARRHRPHRPDRRHRRRRQKTLQSTVRWCFSDDDCPYDERVLGRHPDGLRRRVRRRGRRGRPRAHPRLRRAHVGPVLRSTRAAPSTSRVADTIGEIVDHRNPPRPTTTPTGRSARTSRRRCAPQHEGPDRSTASPTR